MVLGWWGTAAAQQPFPEQDSWLGLTQDEVALEESSGDAITDEPSQDLLGTDTSPVLSWYATDEVLFFRLHVLGDPAAVPATWALLLDVDGDVLDFEYLVQVSGEAHRLDVLSNDSDADGTWVEEVSTVEPLGFGELSTGAVAMSQSSEGYWVDLQLLRSSAESLGWQATTSVHVAGVTSDYWPLGTADVAGCDPVVDNCTLLDRVLSDPLVVDADLDGAPGPLEQESGTDPQDADTDDDGLLDDLELEDVLSDGVNDALQCDSDGDGISDGTELALTVPASGTKVEARCFVADVDPGTQTDPHDPDSDGGGLLDGQEDADHDGALEAWETDPLDDSDDADSDGDTVADLHDELFGTGPDEDSDGDTLLDSVEGQGDSDGDDTPDFADLDSDEDTLSDTLEGTADGDGDGAEDFRDPDSDDDGMLDSLEGMVDSDNDGQVDMRDIDSDADGLLDELEGSADTDGDTVRDSLDSDSDEDALSDLLEGKEDTDGDGLRDSVDPDSDNDGVPDASESNDDTDDDDWPDWLDGDSDNDGVPDGVEGEGDADCDGRIDRLDSDPEDGFCETLTPPSNGDGVPPDRLEDKPASEGCGCQTSPLGGWTVLFVLALLLGSRRLPR